MLKVALWHFLNPCFLDVGCVIVQVSALCLRVDEGEVLSLEKPDADCRNLGNPAGPPIWVAPTLSILLPTSGFLPLLCGLVLTPSPPPKAAPSRVTEKMEIKNSSLHQNGGGWGLNLMLSLRIWRSNFYCSQKQTSQTQWIGSLHSLKVKMQENTILESQMIVFTCRLSNKVVVSTVACSGRYVRYVSRLNEVWNEGKNLQTEDYEGGSVWGRLHWAPVDWGLHWPHYKGPEAAAAAASLLIQGLPLSVVLRSKLNLGCFLSRKAHDGIMGLLFFWLYLNRLCLCCWVLLLKPLLTRCMRLAGSWRFSWLWAAPLVPAELGLYTPSAKLNGTHSFFTYFEVLLCFQRSLKHHSRRDYFGLLRLDLLFAYYS